jgi:hypothetical protein
MTDVDSEAPVPHYEPDTLTAAAEYTGANTARAIAISVGWARSQLIILINISLVASVFTFMVTNDPPYKAYWLILIACGAGILASGMLWAITRRTTTWVDFFNEKLSDIEKVGNEAPVGVFSSAEFNQIAQRWGAGKMVMLFSYLGIGFWTIMGVVITYFQYQQFFLNLIWS